MNYMLLLHSDANTWNAMTDEQRGKSFAAYMAYNAELAKAGALKLGEQLMPASTAKCVRKKGASVTSTDGPFTEIRETLGGFYILSCATEEEALALAKKCPALDHGGTVEVRGIVELNRG